MRSADLDNSSAYTKLEQKGLAHLPEKLGKIGPTGFTGGHHQEFSNFEIFWIGEEQNEKFLNVVGIQGDVIICSNT